MMPDCRDARPCVSVVQCPDFVMQSNKLAIGIFQSDNNSSTDDTDKADLRGFLSRLRRDGIRFATNYTNFHEFRHKLRLRKSALT
jgi:hypothetical protein